MKKGAEQPARQEGSVINNQEGSFDRVPSKVYVTRIPISSNQVEIMRGYKVYADRVSRSPGEGENIIDYSVINADIIKNKIPELWDLLHDLEPRIKRIAERLWKRPLQMLDNKAAVNINYVHKGGQQGFHTDRNEVTVLLYFTKTDGGALEYELPGGTVEQISPEQGRVVVIVGANKLKHRVAPVTGNEERIVLATAYGDIEKFQDRPGLDAHIYKTQN